MVKKESVLRPMAAWFVIGGILTLLTSLLVFMIQFKAGMLLAIPVVILCILIASSEITSGRSVWRSELGGYRGVVITLMMVLLLRLVLILATYFPPTGRIPFPELWLYANILLGAGELALLVYLSRHREFFMAADRGESRILATTLARTVSECPTCHEVVEAYWQSCPYCGTRLPRTCSGCGKDLGNMLAKCPHCGKEVMESASLKKTIAAFRALAEEDALPETKATRYARLGEALLKNGEVEEAVAAYKKAIEYTRFKRKRTNFMVQVAKILKNTGRKEEADVLLAQALEMDPEDYAGAKKAMT